MTPEELARIKRVVAVCSRYQAVDHLGSLFSRYCTALLTALDAEQAKVAKMTAALELFACVNSWDIAPNDDPDKLSSYIWDGDYDHPTHIAQRALGHTDGEGCGCDSCRYFGGIFPDPV